MLRNFLKLTFRNLFKNRTFVIINIIGMGLSLACCVVAYLNYDFAVSFDRNHEHISKIYKIHSNKEVQGDKIPHGITPLALAPSLEGESSAIKMVSRYTGGGLIMQKGDNVLMKNFAFVDEDYFKMFSYPLKYGTAESLNEKGNVILSEKTASLYFDEENPVGKMIKLRNDDQEEKSFRVSGILEDIPENTSMQFDGLLSFENYFTIYDTENVNWKSFVAGTFIYVDDESNLASISGLLQKYVPIQNKARPDWLISDFELIPLTILGKVARDVRANWMWSAPHPASVIAPPIMALLLLLIACFNFTNTSIAISSKRLKEIGIRKVMGSNRNQLIAQFMGENLVLCIVSLIVGLAIAMWLVPAYSAMWEGMTLEFNLLKDSELILFLLGLLVFTALIAGAYPSIYISSYQPVNILRGSMKVGSSKKFSYSLLTAQYAFTVVALFASIAFSRNAVYQRSMDLGFDRQTILYTQVTEPNEAKLLKSALSNNPKVLSVGVSGQHIGMWTYSRTLSQQKFELEADMMSFGENYFETMNVKLLKGRLFDKQNEEYDKQNSIIINEKLVSEFGWQEPIGQRLSVNDSTKLTVVGVVKNFYYNGFWSEIAPMGIRTANDDNLRFIVAKTNLSDVKEIRDFMESEMLAIAPDKPFDGDYQDQLLKESKSVNDNIVIIFFFLGILAIILSAIGLFTLVSLDVHKRIKEIGVRKVLGASIPSLIHLINKHFLIMLAIASVLGTLAAYFIIDILISSIFTYYQEIDAITVVLPILIIFVISIFISSSRVLGSAKQNPVESLRYE
ncbi:MAG: putative ABC transport system permease protein [Cyclobacteriaceae bacterium]|jgi:putative ABC transport system permease protein